jgi:hypothetical protein
METLHDDLVEAEQISAALVDVFTPDEAVLSE